MAHGGHGGSITGIPLLDEDITTPEEMQAMARALRGQQLAGSLLSTMGAGPKAAPMIGQQITQGATQQLGGLGQALLGSQQMQMQRQELAQKREAAMQEAATQRTWREQEAQKDRALREMIARLGAGRQNEAREERQAARQEKREAATYMGPDFELAPEVPPGSIPNEIRAKRMDEAGTTLYSADAADKIRALVRKHGPELYGKAATEMSVLVEDLRLTLKDPVYNLGVLNGRDYELLSKVVADPTNFGTVAKSATGIRDIDKALETASKQWRGKVVQRMRAIGANPKPGGKYDPGKPDVQVQGKPDIRARRDELKAAGATPDAIKAQLMREYTPEEIQGARRR